jgi:hypothetical protein
MDAVDRERFKAWKEDESEFKLAEKSIGAIRLHERQPNFRE